MITLKKSSRILWRSYQFFCTTIISLYLFVAFQSVTREIRLPNGFHLAPTFNQGNLWRERLSGERHIRLLDKNRATILEPQILDFYWTENAVFGGARFNKREKYSCFIATIQGDLLKLPECKNNLETMKKLGIEPDTHQTLTFQDMYNTKYDIYWHYPYWPFTAFWYYKNWPEFMR